MPAGKALVKPERTIGDGEAPCLIGDTLLAKQRTVEREEPVYAVATRGAGAPAAGIEFRRIADNLEKPYFVQEATERIFTAVFEKRHRCEEKFEGPRVWVPFRQKLQIEFEEFGHAKEGRKILPQ